MRTAFHAFLLFALLTMGAHRAFADTAQQRAASDAFRAAQHQEDLQHFDTQEREDKELADAQTQERVARNRQKIIDYFNFRETAIRSWRQFEAHDFTRRQHLE